MKATQLWLDNVLEKTNCKLSKSDNKNPKWKSIKKNKPVDYSFFFASLKSLGIDQPVAEYKFHKTRKWRIDFCWPDKKLALEIEGGAWTNGRHTRGSGFIKDMEKYNQISVYRFFLLRVTPTEIQNGVAVDIINQFFNGS